VFVFSCNFTPGAKIAEKWPRWDEANTHSEDILEGKNDFLFMDQGFVLVFSHYNNLHINTSAVDMSVCLFSMLP